VLGREENVSEQNCSISVGRRWTIDGAEEYSNVFILLQRGTNAICNNSVALGYFGKPAYLTLLWILHFFHYLVGWFETNTLWMQKKRTSFFLNAIEILLFPLAFNSLEKFVLRKNLFKLMPAGTFSRFWGQIFLNFWFVRDDSGKGIRRPLKVLLTLWFVQTNLFPYKFILGLD
jgi:hypothetical protein